MQCDVVEIGRDRRRIPQMGQGVATHLIRDEVDDVGLFHRISFI